MRILIIDDDPNYGQAMTSFLTGQNHDVHRILDPKIALKRIKEEADQFDVILLDLIMPGMSGLELLRKLREAGIPLPVVLVSGFADLESSAEAVHWGISQVMNTSIDCWHSFSGGNRANLAESSGIWKVNIDGGAVRTRTLDRYLKVETLPNRPKLERVLATAKFVLDSSPPSSQRFELDTKIRLLELTLDALGLWAPKQRINKFDNTLIAKLPATKMEE